MQRKYHIALAKLFQPINPSVSSILGMLTFCWGLWVINPWWSVFGTAMLYSKMHEFAPEWAWGSWATIAGAYLVYTALRTQYSWLVYALGFISWHWFVVSLSMWVGDWQNTGGITYSFICFYCCFCYLNIKMNYVGLNRKSAAFKWVSKFLH